jgi:chromosome segregation ATPase
MVEARRLSVEALEMMSKANDMCDEAEAKIIAERNRASARLREERAHHSRESVQCRQKQVAAIDKLHQVQASLVEEIQSNSKKKLCKVREKQLSSVEEIQSKSKNKLCNVREKVVMLSTKLKEQHSIWQKRLAEIDSSSKNRISNERQIRRNLIQNQLDRTSALKSQLMEIIEGLEVMNSELVDEVKAAKKGMREADRLYNKTKEAAAKQLGQLRQEKKEKNQLKDELTRVLKAQEAQEAQLDKYKSMVKSFQSTKRSLKPEIKIGRRGGASWPLWVTDLSVLAASVRLLAFWGGGSR